MKHTNKLTLALTRLIALLLVSFTLMSLTAIAAGAGSSSDPLVTLSYLTERFLPDALSKVDEKIAERDAAVSAALRQQVRKDTAALEEKYGSGGGSEGESAGTVDSFTVVTLAEGQCLYGAIGCEVLLRVGTATCVSPSSPGLIDATDAKTLDNGGALVKNHLYMMTIEDRAVKATAATVKILVRGTYEIA